MDIFHKIRTKYRQFKRGIKNLIRWRKIIFRDQDWDYEFIYELLYKKLEHMEQFFRSDHTYSALAEETANEIKLVKEALERLIKHEYLDEELKEYHNTYGEDDELWTTEPIEGKNSSRLVWTENQEQLDMFGAASKRADKREQEDLDFVFSYMREHIQRWWD